MVYHFSPVSMPRADWGGLCLSCTILFTLELLTSFLVVWCFILPAFPTHLFPLCWWSCACPPVPFVHSCWLWLPCHFFITYPKAFCLLQGGAHSFLKISMRFMLSSPLVSAQNVTSESSSLTLSRISLCSLSHPPSPQCPVFLHDTLLF